MGPLISYGRVSHGGPPDLIALFDVIDGLLDLSNLAAYSSAVQSAVDALEGYITRGCPGGLRNEVLAALGAALRNKILADIMERRLLKSHRDLLRRTTKLFIPLWKQGNPIETTSLEDSYTKAIGELKTAATKLEKTRIQEQLGVISGLYNAAAAFGQDIRQLIGGDPVTVPGTNYKMHRGADGKLHYFEGSGPYSVNGMIVAMAGKYPLIVTFEAKGGKSILGSVRADPPPRRVFQNEREYVQIQAGFMRRSKGDPATSALKREAGNLLMRAILTGGLLHMTSRMDDQFDPTMEDMK